MKKIRIRLFGHSDVSENAKELLAQGQQQLAAISQKLDILGVVFKEGGTIEFNQLLDYEMSTPGNPKKYETGRHCFAYRLESDNPNQIVFFCTFEPPAGEVAEYGWHMHPDAKEEVLQLTNNATANGVPSPPFTRSVFQPGEWHNYKMDTFGTILVTFTKVPQQ